MKKAEAFRADMEKEIGYQHWDDEQRRLLEKVLKWFNRFFDGTYEIKR